MSFLNPLVLLALAAAAIPVILHLINVQRPRRISFSSLTFVRAIQQESVQRLRIRKWLLLALRVAIVIFLVMAFAGPTIPGSWWGSAGDRDAMSVGIVLDTSPSMMYDSGNGPRMDGARERLQQLVDQLERRDEVFTATTTDASPMRHGSVASAVERLSSEQPSPGVQPLTRVASRMAAFVDREARHSARATIVISDLQRSTMVDSVETSWPNNMQAFMMPVITELNAYPAVTNLEITSPFATVGGSVEVTATIETFARGEDAVTYNAHLYLGDERVAQRSMDTGAMGVQQLEFSVSPAEAGWLPLRLELDHGGPLPSNRRYAVLHVPGDQRILIVRGTGQETRYLETVLGLTMDNGGPFFEVDVVDEATATDVDFAGYDAVLLAGLHDQVGALQEDIQQYVRNGGGVHVFPGPPGSDASTNMVLEAFNLPTIADRQGTGGPTPASRIADYNLEHPVLQGVFEDGAQIDQIEQPAVMRFIQLGEAPRQGNVIARLVGGQPLVYESPVQRGRVVMWAIAPDAEWSELPQSGLFVPLVHRSVQLSAAGVGAAGPVLLAGHRGQIDVQSTDGDEGHLLVGPGGQEHTLLATSQGGMRRLSVRPAPRYPGTYELRQGDELIQRVAINMAPSEADPLVYTSEETRSIFGEWLQQEPTVIEEDDDASIFGALLAEAGVRTHIWNLFILLAVICALTESLVARRWSAPASSPKPPDKN